MRLILSAFIAMLLSRAALTQIVLEAQHPTILMIEKTNRKIEYSSLTGEFASERCKLVTYL